jgi:hypothetical protein
MALRRQPAAEGFELVERPEQLGLGERVDGQRGQLIKGRAQRGNPGLHRLSTHDSNICSNSKNSATYF